MASAHMDRRVAKLESRVADIEESHGETLFELTRHHAKSDLMDCRTIGGFNRLGRGIALMMERMGLPPIDVPVVTPPTEEEIDAQLEENC